MSSLPASHVQRKPEVAAQYQVRFSRSTNCWHYDSWLLVDGRRVDWGSGCSIGPRAFGYNKWSCTLQAKRSARKLLRLHLLAERAGGGITGTITPEEIA